MYELQVLVVAAARQLPRLHGLAHAGAGLLAVQAAGAVAERRQQSRRAGLSASSVAWKSGRRHDCRQAYSYPGVLSGARVQVCV